MNSTSDTDYLPDVRDGLNSKERALLHCLNQLQKERGDRFVPTPMLYGRVIELVDMSVEEMQRLLQRFTTKP